MIFGYIWAIVLVFLSGFYIGVEIQHRRWVNYLQKKKDVTKELLVMEIERMN